MSECARGHHVQSDGSWKDNSISDIAEIDLEAWRRRNAIVDKGYFNAHEAAEAADDCEAMDRIAELAGYPYDPPLASRRKSTGFFTSVGESLREGLKPIQWLVRKYIEADTLALFFGDPASGKSFAAIDIACCVATGTPWHSNKTNPGAVSYIAGEGKNGLHRRFKAWSEHNNVSLFDVPLFTSHRPALLCTAAAAAEVANEVAAMREECGHTPSLIVVDTLARNFGGDENNAVDMGAFVTNLDKFLRKSDEWSATVLVVHHCGKADKTGSRGSSALKGAIDAEYSITKDESGIVRIEPTKMKDAEHPPAMAFKMKVLELEGMLDDEGEPVTSVALSSVAHVPPAKNGRAGRGKNQTLALSMLRDLVSENRKRVADGGRDPEHARVTLDEWRARMGNGGMNRFQARDVIDGLRDRGVIALEVGGFVRLVSES